MYISIYMYILIYMCGYRPTFKTTTPTSRTQLKQQLQREQLQELERQELERRENARKLSTTVSGGGKSMSHTSIPAQPMASGSTFGTSATPSNSDMHNSLYSHHFNQVNIASIDSIIRPGQMWSTGSIRISAICGNSYSKE